MLNFYKHIPLEREERTSSRSWRWRMKEGVRLWRPWRWFAKWRRWRRWRWSWESLLEERESESEVREELWELCDIWAFIVVSNFGIIAQRVFMVFGERLGWMWTRSHLHAFLKVPPFSPSDCASLLALNEASRFEFDEQRLCAWRVIFLWIFVLPPYVA